MAEVEHTVVSLLTEHLGYPPLSLIDDVINIVNQLLYKCSSAMQQYLLKRMDKDSPYTKQDIEQGVATLETLLETQVDNNFDKFELYTLRNILMLPQDLVQEGWIRLKHQEGIDFEKKDKDSLDKELKELREKIRYELIIRNLLRLQILKGKKILSILKLYQAFLGNFSGAETKDSVPTLSQPCIDNLKAISPLDENLYFLLKQVKELKSNTEKILNKLNTANTPHIEFNIDIRSSYIDSRTNKILQQVGIIGREEVDTATPLTSFQPTFRNVEDLKEVNNMLDLE